MWLPLNLSIQSHTAAAELYRAGSQSEEIGKWHPASLEPALLYPEDPGAD